MLAFRSAYLSPSHENHQTHQPANRVQADQPRRIARIKETGRPQTLSLNGKPSVVVTDTAVWPDIQDQFDNAETVAETVAVIRRGLTQARAGEGSEAGRFSNCLNQTR